MRTPLGIIMQLLDELRQILPSMPKQETKTEEGLFGEISASHIVGHLYLQVNLLNSYVNDLLDMAQIESGYFTFNPSDFNL